MGRWGAEKVRKTSGGARLAMEEGAESAQGGGQVEGGGKWPLPWGSGVKRPNMFVIFSSAGLETTNQEPGQLQSWHII